jgi:AraC-like DNA-binding protein
VAEERAGQGRVGAARADGVLREGDVTLLPNSGPYAAADHPDTPTVPITDLRTDHEHARTASVGGAGAATEIICGVYDFAAGLPHPFLSALPSFVHLPAASATPGAPVNAAARLLAAEVEAAGPGAPGVTIRLLDVLLVYILRAWQERHGNTTAGWFGALRDPQIGRAIALMHEAPDQRWTVARLAGAVGLSRAAFARRFAALAGEPPLTYLTRWRMITAAILLRDGTDPLSVVANRVGYDSEFAFARTFRRAFGEPPGRYRASARFQQLSRPPSEPGGPAAERPSLAPWQASVLGTERARGPGPQRRSGAARAR